MDNGSILFFDSGVGGLTTLFETMKLLPNERYIYLADNKNCPYGNRSKEEIIRLVDGALKEVFARRKIKMLVFACNTLTTCAIKEFRRRYDIDIVGTEPAINLAMKNSTSKQILVISTRATSRQKRLKTLCDNAKGKVFKLPIKSLASDIEKSLTEGKCFDLSKYEKYIASAIKKHPKVDALVLGCTHYCYVRSELKRRLNVKVFDGNNGVARRVLALLKENNKLNEKGSGGVKIMTTSGEEMAERYGEILEKIKNL